VLINTALVVTYLITNPLGAHLIRVLEKMVLGIVLSDI
jgi:multisubunit Na+/H+ antiporter MnhG subunit